MATTKPIIFTSIGIGDADGTNVTNYDLYLTDQRSITVTPTYDMVDDGLSLPAFWDVDIEAMTFNSNAYGDARVYTNASATVTKSTLVLRGAPGAQTMNITSAIVSGHRVYDGNRTAVMLKITKRAVSADELVGLS